MAEDTGTLPGDTQSVEPVDESAVIKELRKQIREKDAEIASFDEDKIRAEAVASVKREAEATKLMEKAGYKGLTDVYLGELEGEPSADSAKAFLDKRGLTTPEPSGDDAKEQSEVGETAPQSASPIEGHVLEGTPAEVAQVAAVGSELSAATANVGTPDPLSDINAIPADQDPLTDLTRLAAEGGYLST